MKKAPYPHFFVRDELVLSESVAIRQAQEIANEEDEPVKVFMKDCDWHQRRVITVVQPQTEEVPA